MSHSDIAASSSAFVLTKFFAQAGTSILHSISPRNSCWLFAGAEQIPSLQSVPRKDSPCPQKPLVPLLGWRAYHGQLFRSSPPVIARNRLWREFFRTNLVLEILGRFSDLMFLISPSKVVSRSDRAFSCWHNLRVSCCLRALWPCWLLDSLHGATWDAPQRTAGAIYRPGDHLHHHLCRGTHLDPDSAAILALFQQLVQYLWLVHRSRYCYFSGDQPLALAPLLQWLVCVRASAHTPCCHTCTQ